MRVGASMAGVDTAVPVPRPYHHGNLREALVQAGVQLAVESGPAAVLLREAARRVGVSHNAGYRHFSSRDELVAAVAQRGMSRLACAMTEALRALEGQRLVDQAARVRSRLRAIGGAYVGFALDEPGLFRTAFASGLPGGHGPSAADAGPYQILGGVLDEFVAAGVIPAGRRPYSEVVAWSAVHGLAVLALDGPLRGLPDEGLHAALDRVCDVVESGL